MDKETQAKQYQANLAVRAEQAKENAYLQFRNRMFSAEARMLATRDAELGVEQKVRQRLRADALLAAAGRGIVTL